jgi:hypothetical protein
MAQPSQALLNRLSALLATDTTTLAPAAGGVKVHLAQNAFAPSLSLALGSLTEANFTGYAALLAAVGNQQNFQDPVTGNGVVQLVEPLGGWHWATTGTANLPQTIYGFYVTDNGSATLYGSALFSAPITLTASGQGIDIAQVRFAVIPTAMV